MNGLDGLFLERKKLIYMNTIFKHKILAGAMLCGALFVASSCDDSEGLKVTPEVPYADKTLYEVITSDPELTDFVEVLNSCGEHCADSLFNKSRVYTVWAPKNGTFDKDAIIAQAADDREFVFKSFIKAHVANHLHAANGKLEKNKILLLNDKVVEFNGYRSEDGVSYTFDGVELDETNIRVWNGILHKLSSPAEYKYNIWEYLKLAEGVDSVANYLYSFDKTEFDESKSIMGPIVNGEQTYLDSVFVTSNKLLNVWDGVGLLDDEDSTYTVYVPTNEIWNEVKELTYRHFNFNKLSNPINVTSEERDSLREHYARINIIKYMTYSDNEQIYVDSPDSVMPAWRGQSVFVDRAQFIKSQLEECVVFEKKLSNGTFKIVNKFPYNQFELWHDTIKVEGEDQNMGTLGSYPTISVTKDDLAKDSTLIGTKISGGAYLQCFSSRNPVNLKYRLPDALAASYKLAVVAVPKGFPATHKDDASSVLLKMTLQQTILKDSTETTESLKTFEAATDPTKIDTVYLADEDGNPAVINIPRCEYYRTFNPQDYALELLLSTRRSGAAHKDPSICIDEIILIPVKDAEE